MAEPLRVGIVSFAHPHALSYVAELRQLAGVAVRVTDPGPWRDGDDRGRALAARLGVDYADDLDDLLAWGPDAVVIASENARHRADVERAAAAGAHILCEKPLATTLDDAHAIRDAVRAAGVTLTVAYPVRFARAFGELRELHASGRLGQLLAVRGSNNGKLPGDRAWFTDEELSGGGALMDHVVHVADLVDGLAGADPVAVTAVVNSTLHDVPAGLETAGLVTVAYADGLVAAIDCSWSRPASAPTWGGLRISVAGTGGSVDVDFFGRSVQGIAADDGRAIELPYAPGTDGDLIGEFLRAARTGVQGEPDVEGGIRTVAVALAARESARSGRTVTLTRGADGRLTFTPDAGS
ncbi:Gfo/Idh/MocA family protein [Jiangella muralis]|uniref:Gfo/Idh/MocA family protein n=1 Tax=Jiangella muralis TaxID=702383 RepID=UPI00069E4436|nr:Gfo/Idh/MocA family oxidoreductase [Jiangella muralis]